VPELTAQQQAAAAERGNVLVMAGAGTGKTRTLVERCLQRLLDPAAPAGLDQILVVTFTEAAAAETRQRIRRCLEEAAAQDPANARLAEAVALADAAHIGTLHSFCLALVREHFHELGLDPQLSVLDPAQAAILAARTLDDLVRRHYAGATPADEAVQEFVMTYGGGRDDTIREVVLRLHAYAQTLPDATGWLRSQRALLDQTEPAHWRDALLAGFCDWRREWLEHLAELASANPKAASALAVLGEVGDAPARGQIASALAALLDLDADWPRGTKTKFRKPLEDLFADARFLADLAAPAGGADPLTEDWDWVRPHLAVLLDLAAGFGAAFAVAKRELAAVDFQDLEQFALRLLWDPAGGAPTALAGQWRARLTHVFVDEYQDINAAQDTILRALSRDGAEANRFLVGDVKQSIYRFRLADPRIFQSYAGAWRGGPAGLTVPLNENFRSRPALLEFVNALFAPLMRREVGGVDYDADAHLRPGRPAPPDPESGAVPPPVELLLHVPAPCQDQSEESDAANSEEPDERSRAETEAALVAARLRDLKAGGLRVWDEGQAAWRPAEWRDMVVLLRAPRPKAEIYAKEFARAGVPLLAKRSGLYDALEVSDLLSLLQLLDNPLQDIPLLAVLRSPLVGLGVDELAVVRLTAPDERFWTALRRFHETQPPQPEVARATSPATSVPQANPPATSPASPATAASEIAAARASAWPKVDLFLQRYARWRDAARLSSLSQCLETVLDDTRYEDGLRAQPRGAARVANVQRLLALTRDFDRRQRQGLFRFLQFLEAQQTVEFDPEPAQLDDADAVRLMSIHQSKGLEFPVVVVADLGKPFNLRDLAASLVLDEQHGLAPLVRPPGLRQSYPSLPHWLAGRRGRREALGEELRLLYVAATRARDHLILAGSVSARTVEGWTPPPGGRFSAAAVLGARHPLDWLGPLMPALTGAPDWFAQAEGRGRLLAWRIVRGVGAEAASAEPTSPAPPALDEAQLAALSERLVWQYPHLAATREPAKASVTGLRRRALEAGDDEAARWFQVWTPRPAATTSEAKAKTVLSAAERGVAHHRFLQFADWTALTEPAGVKAEADRLVRAGRLMAVEAANLDAAALAALGCSELGTAIRAEAAWLRRELEFTARLSPADFAALRLPCAPGLGADEFVVVQGVVDLAVLAPQRIWIADFKTDAVAPADLAARTAGYAPQLRLYALAVGRVYGRPVSAAWLHFLAVNQSVPVPLAG
jgi:ATP-dependent helicase/nuclease subunit A